MDENFQDYSWIQEFEVDLETIRGSLMKPKWQKLASLAQDICTLKFQLFGAIFVSNGYPFNNILTSLQLVTGTVWRR